MDRSNSVCDSEKVSPNGHHDGQYLDMATIFTNFDSFAFSIYRFSIKSFSLLSQNFFTESGNTEYSQTWTKQPDAKVHTF